MRRLPLLCLWLILSPNLVAEETSLTKTDTKIVILTNDRVLNVPNAIQEKGGLWVPAGSLEAINGFELKPQGLCCADICIPVSPSDKELVQSWGGGKLINLTVLAKRLGQPMVHDDSEKVYYLGPVPEAQGKAFQEANAPDFAIPDRQGKIVHLSDFKGKKVMLLAWASWCGCSLDLPGWQSVYDELKGQNFELVAIALDTEGESAAGKFYDRAKATYTTLIDTKHTVGSLYQMVNVPSGVWIDEEGRIVRPAEVAYSKKLTVLGQEIGDEKYVPALRDWVEKGSASEFVMNPDKLAEHLQPRSENLAKADAYFKLGVYFYEQGDRAEAKKYWEQSQQLNPENWNYHRQDWSFSGTDKIVKWMEKVRGLNGRPYYDPIDWATR
jgi:peroxiredoxin